MTKKQRAALAVNALKQEYPDAICSLTYQDPLQLLISTRLAAQCTDARVNMVTPALFERFPTVNDFAEGSVEEIEDLIRSCGLYKTKARDIHAMCVALRDKFNGEVPSTMEELLTLPGVGRKTANLVLGDIFHQPAVVTDTHCIRICGRLGLSEGKDPAKVETQLRAILPMEEANDFCHRLVLHGRAVCDARNPRCSACCMSDFCKFEQKKHTGSEKKEEPRKLRRLLLVIDYQNDFVSGPLGFPKAVQLEKAICDKIREYQAAKEDVAYTLDTHHDNYLESQEGKKLPVPHCLHGSPGWMLYGQAKYLLAFCPCFEKETFASSALLHHLEKNKYDQIELVGVVSNICVLSNAVIARAALPEAEIIVDANCVAGADAALHEKALDVLEGLQVTVRNR